MSNLFILISLIYIPAKQIKITFLHIFFIFFWRKTCYSICMYFSTLFNVQLHSSPLLAYKTYLIRTRDSLSGRKIEKKMMHFETLHGWENWAEEENREILTFHPSPFVYCEQFKKWKGKTAIREQTEVDIKSFLWWKEEEKFLNVHFYCIFNPW